MKLLLTTPSLNDLGGVASYINSVLPFIAKEHEVQCYEIGSTRNKSRVLHPVVDQAGFRQLMTSAELHLCHINPSLNLKSFLRDGLFVWQAKKAGLPVLVFFHGWQHDFARIVSRRLLWFFRRTFGQADAFIVLASEFERQLRAWGVTVPVHLGTTTVDENLLCGFDLTAKLEQRQRAATKKILFLARLERAKGVFEIIQAVRLLLDQNKPVSLTIAGEGKIRPELEEFCRNLNLSVAQVRFTGDIRGEDKIRAFAEHDIYCLPSYGEGLPTSVLEAMAFGLPVVTRPVGGLADMFEDGKMGALVKGKSPEEIAGALDKIISNSGKMAEIARYNARYAQEHFMAPVVAKRLVEIYNIIQVGIKCGG